MGLHDWRRGAFVGGERPHIMTLVDKLMSTPLTPKFGAQQYRLASAVAHAAPHAHGLLAGSTSEHAPRDAAQRLLPMVGAFYLAARTLCDRMGWDGRPIRAVGDITLRLWLEAAQPGSSKDLLK